MLISNCSFSNTKKFNINSATFQEKTHFIVLIPSEGKAPQPSYQANKIMYLFLRMQNNREFPFLSFASTSIGNYESSATGAG
jgi:hypothetical protein